MNFCGMLMFSYELCLMFIVDITADESPMTGEPENIPKNEEDPFFLSGCMIMEGVGKGVVVAVGELSQVCFLAVCTYLLTL
jgi:hypothetical protein